MLIMPCNNVIVHYCMENYVNQGTADYFDLEILMDWTQIYKRDRLNFKQVRPQLNFENLNPFNFFISKCGMFKIHLLFLKWSENYLQNTKFFDKNWTRHLSHNHGWEYATCPDKITNEIVLFLFKLPRFIPTNIRFHLTE